jgi:alcohol dehydrogenase YqhD (iron-dependent ADH family)
VELGGVKPNPRLSLVYEGIELCRKEKVNFILPVGGGSVIDSAKAISYGLADPEKGDVWDFYSGTRTPEAVMPLGCVLTLAAAGSEMSNSSVITNEKTMKKYGVNSPLCRPLFAVMNPELTFTVPPFQTAAGCSDILMHTMERYFTPEQPTMKMTDSIAEGLMRTVMDNARILSRAPDNYAARAEVMWAGALSHNDLTSCGGGRGDWATHQLSHELSVRFDTAHGAALTILWASWARYVYGENPARFAQFATNVLEVEPLATTEETALAGIAEMEEFFWGIEMPTRFSEAELPTGEAVAGELVKGCSRGGIRTIGAFKVLNEADMAAIYKMAMESSSL